MIKSFKPKINQRQEPRVQSIGSEMVKEGGERKGFSPSDLVQKFTKGSDREALRVIPLGGVANVTKNMFVYEYKDDIIIIDCGVSFPEEGMLGVDLVIPDISYLKDKKDKIKAIIISHAHDDHIGGLPFIWPELQVPIYSQKLTCGFIKTKFKEHKLPLDVVKTIDLETVLNLGAFKVSFYQVSHSVPDSTGIVIETPVGTLIHQADFKIDWSPVNGQKTDVSKVARLAEGGVKFLTIDCLRAERPGYTPSEKEIEGTFEKLEKETTGKFLITLMTSNITRIQQAINVAVRADRKIAFVGRSMENNVQVARDLGYLDIPANLVIAQDAIKRFADDKLMIIIAGSLGQPESALSRAANNDHRFITLSKNDTVVFSADPMPSAEVSQGNLINKLTKLGVRVIASTLTPDLHVSGHAAAEELKLMVNLIKPEYILPIGGEFKQMTAFSRMAQGLGYRENQIMLPEEGDVIEISQKVQLKGYVKTSNVYVDGLGIGDVGNIILRDREVMSKEGMVVVVVPIDEKEGKVLGEPDIISRGFVYGEEGEDLIAAGKEMVRHFLDQEGKAGDWRYTRDQIQHQLEKFFFEETKRRPMILTYAIRV